MSVVRVSFGGDITLNAAVWVFLGLGSRMKVWWRLIDDRCEPVGSSGLV